jgi:hypothetical protein
MTKEALKIIAPEYIKMMEFLNLPIPADTQKAIDEAMKS